tara:strand:- start:422 stop:640 length:219 start_codon:yes stop_codon:yes gene_type:complete
MDFDKIKAEMKRNKALLIGGVSGSVDLTRINNTTSAETINNVTTDTTTIKAGWYSDNFNTYYLDDDGVKHYR